MVLGQSPPPRTIAALLKHKKSRIEGIDQEEFELSAQENADPMCCQPLSQTPREMIQDQMLTDLPSRICVNDLLDDSISRSNQEEDTQKSEADMQQIHDLLHKRSLPVVPMVIQPEQSGKTHGKRRKTD